MGIEKEIQVIIEGVNYNSDEQKRIFESCLPALKELYMTRYVDLAVIFNKKIKKWNKKLNVSEMGKEKYLTEINKLSQEVVQKFNKQRGDTVIKMDVDKNGRIFGHIMNVFDEKAIIYIIRK